MGGCATPHYEEETVLNTITGCDNSSNSWINKYRTPGHWIPDESTPIKTIRVNWIVCRDDDGLNGWQDIPEFHESVGVIFDRLNERFSNSLPRGYPLTCEPDYTHVHDTRIRFELNEVIFLDNTTFNLGCNRTAILDHVFQEYPDSRNSLNHIFTQPENACISGAWGLYGLYNNQDASYVHTWGSMWSDWNAAFSDHIYHIAHEYSHAVGLGHIYNWEYLNIDHYDFLDDVFGLCAEPDCICPDPDDCHCSTPPPSNYVCHLRLGCFWGNHTINTPSMSGSYDQRYISPKSAGRMHRALSLYNNNFRLNNKPMHKYVKEDHSYQIPLTINENETWDFAIKMYQDIVIEPGNTLTITCEVKMPIDGKIIVKPGAQLIVNGGTIKDAHGDFWQGITVLGQQNLPQNTQNQGAVRLSNGAIIENAVIGIQLYDRQSDGEPIESTAGGYLLATDSYFKNNQKAIEGGYYDYSGSVVQNCEFIINSDYYDKTLNIPTFVYIHRINSFGFRGNLFKNEVTDLSVATEKLPIGIRSYNAGLKVLGLNVFENLQYGIKATESSFLNVSEISNNTFTKNFTGIYMSGVNTPQIFFNTFESIPFNAGLPVEQKFTGIYLDGVEGHSVEENTFYSDLSGVPVKQHVSIGLVVNNGGAQNVEVYKNTFHHLVFGILAQNNNRSMSGDAGLCIKCNDFNNNGSDVSVTKDLITPPIHSGIASHQGSGLEDDNAPAGNLFSQTNSNLQWQFNNLTGIPNQITYWYHNYSTEPRLVPNNNYVNNILKMQNIYADYDLACTSHQSSGGSGGGLGDAKSRMAAADTGEEEAKTTLEALVDAGDTPALQTEVSTAAPSEAYEIHNELLETSPYTSDEVLVNATEREDVLNNALIRDVLVANPQAAKNEEVLTAIDNRANAMPDYMKNQINQGIDIVSAKEELEAAAFFHRTSYTNAESDLIFIYLSDTTLSHPMDSVLFLLSTSKNIYAHYQMASIYLNKQDYVNMNVVLDNIENEFELNEMQQTEYEQLSAYFDIMQTVYSSDRNIDQLNSAEKAELLDWYDNEVNLASVYARNILSITGDIDYQEPYILPDELKSSTVEFNTNHQNKSIDSYDMMKLYPNPAKDYLVCEYEIIGEFTEASINMIKSGSGKSQYSQKLNQAQDAKTIDLRELSAGNYMIILMVDGKQLSTGKFSIVR